MSSEDFHGKDCMVQAVVSATGRPDQLNALTQKRIVQMLAHKGQPLNPNEEAGNLRALFQTIGEKAQINVKTISSIAELLKLVEASEEAFVGFASGPDTPPHIAHLGLRVHGGFMSKQQFISDEELSMQLMEQSRITIFIRSK